jgi:hypothetical protein
MITYSGPKFPFVAHAGNPLGGRSRSEPAPASRTTTKLSPGGSLLLIVLLSLGLWATIWKAVSITAASLG